MGKFVTCNRKQLSVKIRYAEFNANVGSKLGPNLTTNACQVDQGI